MLKQIALAVFFGASLFAQAPAQAVNQVQGASPNNYVSLLFYNGSNQVTHVCYAPALVFPPTTYYVSSSTLTSVVVSANTGTITFANPATAYVWIGQQVTLAGSTTSALNGTYKVQTVSGATATITTSGVPDATYNNAALTLSTSGPVLNASVWSIQVLQYASGNLSQTYWAGSPAVGPSQAIACSNRANY